MKTIEYVGNKSNESDDTLIQIQKIKTFNQTIEKAMHEAFLDNANGIANYTYSNAKMTKQELIDVLENYLASLKGNKDAKYNFNISNDERFAFGILIKLYNQGD